MTRLDARLATPTGPIEVRLAAGDAALITPDAVGPLTGIGVPVWERRRHDVVLDGRSLGRWGPAARVRRGLGVVADAPVAADVPIEDQLAAVAAAEEARRVLADAPLLAGRGQDPAGVLSGGERRVLAWLRCQLTRPRAVVLDGAGTGLDAASLAWCGEVVAAWRADGVAVVVRAGRVEEESWALPG